jgi:glutathione S-transferase
MMKLYLSGNSPYARRARLVAREGGLMDLIEEVIISGFEQVAQVSPGGKIPLLVCEDGTVLCESLIITRYLNELAGGRLVPASVSDALRDLEMESVASVLMDSLFVHSMETNQRNEALRSRELITRENNRRTRCYDRLVDLVVNAGDQVTLASIAIISALGYADWRAAEDDWRHGRDRLLEYYDRFMARSAFAETAPKF